MVLPSVLSSNGLCSPALATRTTQYVSSSQVETNQCRKSSGLYNYELSIQAKAGQRLEFILINLKALSAEHPMTYNELGYILESSSDRVTPVTTGDGVETAIVTSDSSSVSVFLSSLPETNYLIGFKGEFTI